ncbi:hypothetical protein [Streptomyces sp. CAI-85]|uniref:hypothetical protein n=1 Tax=Streptomyces sp. CAI-85 TaxID=1472662 RepID=UPI00158749B9|nr:hypothetical protein [Streptomyces sp. CAI-85]NUV60680.1 hypothetical protein [Streptomyces sp. CAI-85]
MTDTCPIPSRTAMRDTADVIPADLPQPVLDLFAALAESLNVPLPSTDPDDERAYQRLMEHRVTHVRVLLESVLNHPQVAINRDAADVRAYAEQTPVTYRTFAEQQAKGSGEGR